MTICTDKHKKELLSYLKKQPAENCLFLGDIENFSLKDDFMDVWKFESAGKIAALLLRYYKFYLVAAENNNYAREMADIIAVDENALILSGVENTVRGLAEYYSFKKIKPTFLAELSKKTFTHFPSDLKPEKAAVADLNELFEFQKSIKEFALDERSRESFGNAVKTDTGRIYYIRQNGKIVSSAAITAENSINGTIIGVATDPAYRRKGYAKVCMSALCKGMIKSIKKVILFYDNPDAGKLYKQIGFTDVNKWAMADIR